MRDMVLVPYKITLLSNRCACSYTSRYVLVPYKITLLSNIWDKGECRAQF